MYDFQVVCFNGADRTKDTETTDAMAIHPITKKCEQFITNFCEMLYMNMVIKKLGLALQMSLIREIRLKVL